MLLVEYTIHAHCTRGRWSGFKSTTDFASLKKKNQKQKCLNDAHDQTRTASWKTFYVVYKPPIPTCSASTRTYERSYIDKWKNQFKFVQLKTYSLFFVVQILHFAWITSPLIKWTWYLFIFLWTKATIWIGEPDRQLLRALDNIFALFWWNAVGNFAAVYTVLHQQNLQLTNIVDQEFLESRRQNMASTLIGTVANVWHQVLTLETPTDAIVDTFRLTPFWLEEKMRRLMKIVNVMTMIDWEQHRSK